MCAGLGLRLLWVRPCSWLPCWVLDRRQKSKRQQYASPPADMRLLPTRAGHFMRYCPAPSCTAPPRPPCSSPSSSRWGPACPCSPAGCLPFAPYAMPSPGSQPACDSNSRCGCMRVRMCMCVPTHACRLSLARRPSGHGVPTRKGRPQQTPAGVVLERLCGPPPPCRVKTRRHTLLLSLCQPYFAPTLPQNRVAHSPFLRPPPTHAHSITTHTA